MPAARPAARAASSTEQRRLGDALVAERDAERDGQVAGPDEEKVDALDGGDPNHVGDCGAALDLDADDTCSFARAK